MAKRVYVAKKSTANELKTLLSKKDVINTRRTDQTAPKYHGNAGTFYVRLEEDMPPYLAGKPLPYSASYLYFNSTGVVVQGKKCKVYNIWQNYSLADQEKITVQTGPGGFLIPRDPEGTVQMFKLTADFLTTDASVAAEVDVLSRSGIAATVTTLYNDLGTFEGSIDDLAQAYYTQGEWVIQQLACPDGNGGGELP
jgi:hypothetical protein